MGEYGMSYQEAIKVPHPLIKELWSAAERRHSRYSLRYLEDALAVGGLQSEVEYASGKKPKGEKMIPTGYIKHWQKRAGEGYPTKPRDPVKAAKEAQENALARFWEDADTATRDITIIQG